MSNHNIIVEAGRWDKMEKLCFPIRTKVFVEEQKVPAELELDENDPHCLHVLASVGIDSSTTSCDDGSTLQTPIATGRLFLETGNIGRMAVLKEFRGKGIGSLLLNGLVEEGRKAGLKQVSLHAQTHAIEFYLKAGFEKEGEEFMEAGIPHIGMVKKFA